MRVHRRGVSASCIRWGSMHLAEQAKVFVVEPERLSDRQEPDHTTLGTKGQQQAGCAPVEPLMIVAGIAGEEDLLVIIWRDQQLEARRGLLPRIAGAVQVAQQSQQVNLQVQN